MRREDEGASARGASAVEYVIIVGVVALVAGGAFQLLTHPSAELADREGACVRTLDCRGGAGSVAGGYPQAESQPPGGTGPGSERPSDTLRALLAGVERASGAPLVGVQVAQVGDAIPFPSPDELARATLEAAERELARRERDLSDVLEPPAMLLDPPAFEARAIAVLAATEARDRASEQLGVARAAYEQLVPSPSVWDEVSGFLGDVFEGALYGDYSDNDAAGATAGQVATGFVPIVGQLADVRDTKAAVEAAIAGEDGSAVGLVVAIIAWVPGLGDVVKGIFRGASGAADEVATSVVRVGEDAAAAAAREETAAAIRARYVAEQRPAPLLTRAELSAEPVLMDRSAAAEIAERYAGGLTEEAITARGISAQQLLDAIPASGLVLHRGMRVARDPVSGRIQILAVRPVVSHDGIPLQPSINNFSSSVTEAEGFARMPGGGTRGPAGDLPSEADAVVLVTHPITPDEALLYLDESNFDPRLLAAGQFAPEKWDMRYVTDMREVVDEVLWLDPATGSFRVLAPEEYEWVAP